MKKRIDLLDLVQTVAIVVGIAYGAVELSNLRAERVQQGALELAQYFQNPRFQTGLAVIVEIPDNATREEIVAAFGTDISLLHQTGQVFETIGVLVWRGELDITLADDLLGRNHHVLGKDGALLGGYAGDAEPPLDRRMVPVAS